MKKHFCNPIEKKFQNTNDNKISVYFLKIKFKLIFYLLMEESTEKSDKNFKI